MTNLGCNAKQCTHNKDKCCCLSGIEVGGSKAEKTEDTCCSNFYEDSSGFKNSAETPKVDLNVACEATSCTYNSNCLCNARHIDISGICASEPDGTVCATYRQR